MNKRDVLEVAVKIMGLYCLLSFLGSVMMVGLALASADSKFIENKVIYISFSCLASILYVLFTVLFLRGGKRIAEMLTRDSDAGHAGERAALPPHAQLHFWIKILGLYFFVSVIGHLVSDVANAGTTIRNSFWWSRLAGEILQIGLSLVFIFKSTCVARLVERHAEPVTGASAG
jgi:hypothetical protein